MKTFADKKAQRTFVNLYDTLSEAKQKKFGRQLRRLADKKVTAEYGNEFYLTTKDVIATFKKLTESV